eukprot:11846605-Ditylum_brightwellii.AAC.1
MFNSMDEVNTFVATHSPDYVKQWLKLWQPYFRKGVDKATTLATTKTKLLTSYFKHKMSSSRVHLPREPKLFMTVWIMICLLAVYKAQCTDG